LLPIIYVWRIKSPAKLIRITTMTQDSIIMTPETKLQAMRDGRFDWFASSEIIAGDMVALVRDNMRMIMVDKVEEITDDIPEYVYDLTVDPAHSFVGNGFVIHNTAAAVKDDFGDGRWTLEAGALVLADKGLACIDELDKMSEQDRSSLHEAMESQKISVAKAGITATLQCRCSMLAAANPKLGRFDEDMSIAQQINLPPALMSRFDLMFVLRDIPDRKKDKKLTEYILKGHWRGQAREQTEKGIDSGVNAERILEETNSMVAPYKKDLLRKYVAYAKKNCHPILTPEAFDIIEMDYLNIRGKGEDGSIPISARQLEAYVRLSEASARMHLRNKVTEADATRAVRLINYYMEKIAKTGSGYDIDLMGGETSQKDRKAIDVIRNIIETHSLTGGITEDEIIVESGLDRAVVDRNLKGLSELAEILENKGKYRMA
jgi:replicative DNA helicase Mcm